MGNEGKTLAERVQEFMVGRNKTVVATQAGLSRTQFLSIMNGGTKHPRIETLDALAEALGTSRDYLLYGKEQDEPELESLPGLLGLINQQRDMLLRQAQRVVEAEARRLADEEWARVLGLLDPETARVVSRARDEAAIRGEGAAARPAAGPVQPRPKSAPSPSRKAS